MTGRHRTPKRFAPPGAQHSQFIPLEGHPR